MLNEFKIFFNNLKNFRHLLTEGIGNDGIINAINNREYIYIYYDGDPETGGVAKGSRVIRCYVLGTSTAGNKVVRAWQDRGDSFSLSPESPRKRPNHEYHTDVDGKQKAGWRLFRLDRISKMYPIGKRFVDKNGIVMIPPLYHENDKQMVSIIASIPMPTPSTVQTKDLEIITKPDITTQKIKKSEFDKQTAKFKQFYDVAKDKRQATANDIEKLYNIVKRVKKKSPDRYFVAIDDNGDFNLVDKINKSKFPKNAIVGDLTNLYSKYVLSVNGMKPEEENFIKQAEEKLKKSIADKKKFNK